MLFKIQSSNFILIYAVEYIKYTHQYNNIIKIQINIIEAFNEKNSTSQK